MDFGQSQNQEPAGLYPLRPAIGYINIVAIVIDLAILLYSAIDYQTLMQTGNLFLFLFLVFTTLIWQTICFVKDFYAYTHKTEYYNLQDIYRHKTPEAADELDEIYTAAPIAFPGTVLRHSDNIDRLLQADRPHPCDTMHRQGKAGY